MNTNFLRGSRRYNNSPNGTANNKSFREFKGKDEDRGLYKVRLGFTTYAAPHTLTRVYTIDDSGELTPVSQYTLNTKAWILRNLEEEINRENVNWMKFIAKHTSLLLIAKPTKSVVDF